MHNEGARSRQSVLLLLLALALGAPTPACSAIVNPDGDRLRPPESDGGPGGLDGGPTCPGGCDDGIACTNDACGETGCTHAPDDGACGAGMRCNPRRGCVPRRCTRDEDCDDGSRCNGVETCNPEATTDPSGCVFGEAIVCDDGAACTNDLCVDAAGGCVFMRRNEMCADEIDCTEDVCEPGSGGADEDGCVHRPRDGLCDDGFCFVGARCDPAIGCTGASARNCSDSDPCTAERCDASMSMCVSEPVDADGDGHAAAMVSGRSCAGSDCDDTRADVFPGATESCGNGRDEDCDRRIDEGCMVTPPETCATAQQIALDGGGRGSVSGTLGAFRDDYAFCGSSGGRDAVYFFEITTLSDVIIDTIGSAPGNDTVLAVGFDCSATPVVCNDDQDPGSNIVSRLFLHRFAPPPAGGPLRVYVYVDGFNAGATGAFTLNVRVYPARPDSCSAEPLDITGGGTVLGLGPLSGVSSASGTCQSLGERSELEGIFRIRTPPDREHHNIAVYATSFVPDVYLRQQPCSGGMELDCDNGSDIGGGIQQAVVAAGDLPSDTFQFLFVDGMLRLAPSGAPHAYRIDYDP